MPDIRIKNFTNTATAANTSLTNAWFAVDKESPDRTERMNADQMFGLDETKIPFKNQNCIFVNAKGTGSQNFTKFQEAVIFANAATPNGLAKSDTNRFVIYLFAGQCVETVLTASITINAWIDIIGIGDPQDIVISSNSATSVLNIPIFTGQIGQKNTNIFKNFTVENLNITPLLSFSWAGIFDQSIMENLIIKGFFQENINYQGVYRNLNCKVDLVLNGNISGLVENCTFKNNSCGYSTTADVYCLGIIKNNTGLDNCFGSTWNGFNCAVGGLQENNKGNNKCFGYSDGGTVTTFGGGLLMDNNTGLSYCFFSTSGPQTKANDGIIQNCTATTNSFGDTTAVGRLINCKRTGAYGVHAGFIEKCDFIGNLTILANATVRRCDIDQGQIIATSVINAKIYLCSLDNPVDPINITNVIPTPYNVVSNLI